MFQVFGVTELARWWSLVRDVDVWTWSRRHMTATWLTWLDSCKPAACILMALTPAAVYPVCRGWWVVCSQAGLHAQLELLAALGVFTRWTVAYKYPVAAILLFVITRSVN